MKRVLLGLIVATGTVGCASTSDMDRLSADVSAARTEAAEAKRSADEAKAAAASAAEEARAARAAADAAAIEAKAAGEKADRIFQRTLQKQ